MNWFSTNLTIGEGMTGTGNFKTPDDLLRHLDYLGIGRALADSRSAADYSPINGNRELLETLAPCRERLFPSFVVTPSDYYENHAAEFYRETARAGTVRMFRLSPYFEFRAFDRILGALDEFHPGVIAGMSPDFPYSDLEYLALHHPCITFIVARQMWRKLENLLHLMWRCPNVSVNTAELHVRGVLELLRDEFGAERLFFGLGMKSQYGAACGALIHSELTPSEKELAAHGNLERLLNRPPPEKKLAGTSPLLADKPLWNDFLAGRKNTSVTISDAHAHFGGSKGTWPIRDHNDLDSQLRNLVRNMDRFGIDRMCVSAGLMTDPVAHSLEFKRRTAAYPGRFLCYVGYNPWYADRLTTEALDSLFSDDFFIGFKTLCAYWQVRIDDPRFEPMWQYADRYRLPILNHTWNDSWDNPSLLESAAARYPGAAFILGHSGGELPGRLEAEALAEKHPNVFLETCGTFCCGKSLAESIRKLGIGRFVFGTDTKNHDVAFELAHFLSQPLPDRELIPALSANLERILSRRIRLPA